MEVKGTWITDYVRMIRAAKDKPWDQYLTPEDWKIVNSKVLSSVWYPYESFNRIGKAVFREIAQGNLAVSRTFGKMFAENLAAVYKTVLVPGDPASTISKVYALQGTFFRDIPSLIAPAVHEPKRTVVRISVTRLERELGEPEAFAYQFLGMLEQLADKVGARKCQSAVRKVEGGYEIDLSWE
jgi:hypothetical protein